MAVTFNQVTLAGNLTRDPELRFTNDGVPVCQIGLAVNDPYSKNDRVDFFDISIWRELGESVANYKKKGDPILLTGRLRYRTWDAQDGSKRSKVDVEATQVQFLYGPEGSPQRSSQQRGSSQGRQNQTQQDSGDFSDADFEDIPF